jgi:hypothetical protein
VLPGAEIDISPLLTKEKNAYNVETVEGRRLMPMENEFKNHSRSINGDIVFALLRGPKSTLRHNGWLIKKASNLRMCNCAS